MHAAISIAAGTWTSREAAFVRSRGLAEYWDIQVVPISGDYRPRLSSDLRGLVRSATIVVSNNTLYEFGSWKNIDGGVQGESVEGAVPTLIQLHETGDVRLVRGLSEDLHWPNQKKLVAGRFAFEVVGVFEFLRRLLAEFAVEEMSVAFALFGANRRILDVDIENHRRQHYRYEAADEHLRSNIRVKAVQMAKNARGLGRHQAIRLLEQYQFGRASELLDEVCAMFDAELG